MCSVLIEHHGRIPYHPWLSNCDTMLYMPCHAFCYKFIIDTNFCGLKLEVVFLDVIVRQPVPFYCCPTSDCPLQFKQKLCGSNIS